MRNIAICGSQDIRSKLGKNFIEAIEINSIPVFCGLLHTGDISFNRNSPENKLQVLVKKRAFSCNYRDKRSILTVGTCEELKSFFKVIGSDFVGEVIDTGSEVTELQIGDRVIANNTYGEFKNTDICSGLSSTNSSKEYEIFHQSKLIKIPSEMPDEVAAIFSVGAQTSYSMIRKINPIKGANILVTAAKSNTSLFTISALHKYNVNIYATTTSLQFAEELEELGVKEVILLDSKPNGLISNESIQRIVADIGGFDCVIDPFFDIYLGQAVKIMAQNSKYITCGLYDQYCDLTREEFTSLSVDFKYLMLLSIEKNIQIIGNCLGHTQDLNNGIHDYLSGNLKVIIDSVFTDKQISSFFERTYNAKDRFGKVVYKYT